MGAAGFPLGRVCATRGVAHDMERDAAFARFVAGSLARYRRCDWGDVSAADGKANSRRWNAAGSVSLPLTGIRGVKGGGYGFLRRQTGALPRFCIRRNISG